MALAPRNVTAAGNAVLAEVATTIERLLGVPTGVSLATLVELSRQVERRTGNLLPPNAPLVGATTHWHESGIHVHGLLRDSKTYEPLPPSTFGLERQMIFGKHSGRAALRARARALGLDPDDAALDRAAHALKEGRPEAYDTQVASLIAAREAYLDQRRGLTDALVMALLAEPEPEPEPDPEVG